MTMDPTTESIAHFVGLFELRVDELRLRQDYLEFSLKQTQQDTSTLEPVGVRIQAPYQLTPYNPALTYTASLPDTSNTALMGTFPTGISVEPLADVQQISEPDPAFPPNQIEDGFGLSVAGSFGLVPPGSIVSVTLQKITLNDDDLFLNGLGINFINPAALHATLEAIVAQAEAFAVFAMPDLPADGSWLTFAKDMLATMEAVEAPEGPAEVFIIRGNDAEGIFIDGVEVAEAPVWSDLLPLYLRPGVPTDSEAQEFPEDGETSDDLIAQKLTEAPGEEQPEAHDFDRDFDGHQNPDVLPAGHQIVAGANTAINQISAYSKWLDASVYVVMGDVARVDAISQVNVLVEHDTIDGVAQSQPSLFKNVTAISTISSEDPTAQAGGAPASSFIARIEADLIQINWVKQFTFVTDFDRAEMIFSGTTTYLGLGENEMVNTAALNEFGYTFDLIFVAGNMVDATIISQKNVLYDSDHVTTGGPALADGDPLSTVTGAEADHLMQLAESAPVADSIAVSDEPDHNDAAPYTAIGSEQDQGTDAPPALSLADNLLLNEVTIARTGADTHTELKESFREAAVEMKEGAKTLAQDVTEDTMFSGREALRVLQIDGDLARINLFEQTNIVGDADQIHLEMMRLREELGAEAELIAGSNALVNRVSLVEEGIDSKIMAAQNVYSDAFIHQAGLFDADAVPTGVALSNLSSEAVAAFIAQDAMNAAETIEHITATENYEAGSTTDIMQMALA